MYIVILTGCALSSVCIGLQEDKQREAVPQQAILIKPSLMPRSLVAGLTVCTGHEEELNRICFL